MSTRQATPGPSNVSALNTISMNSRKRGVSQVDSTADPVRKAKKSKGEEAREKNRRRRKKRRKISVTTVPILGQARSRSLSQSRTMAVESRTPTIESAELLSEVILPLPGEDPSGRETLHVEEDPGVTEASSSQVDKGKAKAKEELPSATDDEDSHRKEIERVRKEVEAQILLLEKYKSHFNQVQQSISCEICLDLMHRPFALAPCGHVACHSCLVAWFTREEEDLRALGVPRPRTHVHRRKSCPVCRTLILQRPVELWGLKNMVSNLQWSGLVETAPTSSQGPNTGGTTSSANATAIANDLQDPWHDIFRPLRPERERDPYRPLSPVDGEVRIEDMGMYDAEDGGIYRCLDCMHEIWGNLCSNCGRIYPGHTADIDEEDDMFDDDDEEDLSGHRLHPAIHNLIAFANRELDGEDLDDDSDIEVEDDILNYWEDGANDSDPDEDDEDDDFRWSAERRLGVNRPRLGLHWLDEDSDVDGQPHPRAYIEELDDNEEDEDEYGGSFIDDEGDEPSVDHSRQIYGFDGPSDEESEGIYIHTESPARSPSGLGRHQGTVILTDDDDDSEEEVEFSGVARRAGSRARSGQGSRVGRTAVVISSDEDDGVED